MSYPKTGPVTLEVNLAHYAVTRSLLTRNVTSDIVNFDFTGPKTANEGFKPMVRDGKFDAGELAIGTYLQAKQYGKPLVLLPAVVMGRFQHQTLLANTERGLRTPKDLEGRRVAIRAYAQTTGIWVRGILQHQFGVDLSRLTWVCPDDGHLAEYRDPPNVERVTGKKAEQLLLDGDVDAAVVGALSDPRMRPLIENPIGAAEEWCRAQGAVPVNHFFVVRKELSETRPDVVREIYRMLAESKKEASSSGIDFHPLGIEANRKALELMIQYAVEQQIIPKPFTVDDLFDDTTRAL
jgi:4,5-dihydroxyphthalate decarboxylase